MGLERGDDEGFPIFRYGLTSFADTFRALPPGVPCSEGAPRHFSRRFDPFYRVSEATARGFTIYKKKAQKVVPKNAPRLTAEAVGGDVA